MLQWVSALLTNYVKLTVMEKNIDFTKLSNAEINIKVMGYTNEYSHKKNEIIKLIGELEELDKLYIKATDELKKRGVLSDGDISN